MKKGKVSLHADDTVLFIANDNIDGAIVDIKEDLNILATWCNRNKLRVEIGNQKK